MGKLAFLCMYSDHTCGPLTFPLQRNRNQVECCYTNLRQKCLVSLPSVHYAKFLGIFTLTRRFKRPPKQQNRRRNGILFKTPSFVSTPDSFFPANWPPLQEASQLFPVRVLYYIILVNCNITKYT